MRKSSVFCQTFGSYTGIITMKTHVKGVLLCSVILELGFLLIVDIWNHVQKGSGSTLGSTSCKTFAVYSSNSDLVALCPNLWCNNYRENFFLGVCFCNFDFYFVFTKNACFLCALSRDCILFVITEENSAKTFVKKNKYVPNSLAQL